MLQNAPHIDALGDQGDDAHVGPAMGASQWEGFADELKSPGKGRTKSAALIPLRHLLVIVCFGPLTPQQRPQDAAAELGLYGFGASSVQPVHLVPCFGAGSNTP